MNRFTQTFAILLAGALQIMPMLRNLVTSPAANSTFAIILRWTIGSAASLGAVDAVSGATSAFTTPSSFSGSTGTSFSNNVSCSIGGGNTAAKDDYFYLQAGTVTSPALTNGQTTTVTLPPGLTFKASWVNGASTIGGILYGTPTTAGNYSTAVWVVSPGNAQLSQTITFTISASSTVVAPAITQQPSGTNIIAGRTAKFTVAATGTAPLGYFWLKGGTPLANGGTVSGANTATLTVTNVSSPDAGNYSVIVSNSAGSVTSTAVALSVLVPPTISSQPVGLTQTAGGNVQFAVTAGGSTPLTYRWLKGGAGLTNSAKFIGVNSNLLTIAGVATADAGNYSVAVTNLAGSITSSIAPLTVVSSPTIVMPPASQTVVAGASASFTVAAAGSTPLFFQWLKNTTPLADGGNVSGSATATLSLSGVSTNDAANYSVIVSNSLGNITSAAATLTVLVPPAIVTQPANASVVAGSNVTFTVAASGSPTLTYQWLKNNGSLANGGNVSGATSATLTLTSVSATDAANYSVSVSNAVGGVISGNAVLSVLAPPVITSQPTNATVAQGAAFVLSLTASGTAPMSFQWLKNGGTIPGATSNVLTLSQVTTNDAGSYSAIVTNLAGAATSAAATLTVLVPPAIVTQPANASVVAGSNVTFTVAASGSATLTYQWQKNNGNLSNGGNVSGATSPSLTLTSVSATDVANYSVTVSNAVGGITSGSATLTVLGPPAITSQPTNATVAQGTAVAFSVAASGTAPMSFQWLKNGGIIPGATSNVLTLSQVTTNDAGSYSAIVTNLAGAATSAAATLTVLVPPAIVTQPANASVVAGSNVTFTVAASGSATLTYQWRKNGSALANGGNTSGATSATLTLTSVSATDAANYSVTVSNAVGGVISVSATLTVLGPPVITSQPANATVGVGSNLALIVTATGTAPLSFQWLKNGGTIPGATSNVLTFPAVATNDVAVYSAVVTNLAGSATSSNAVLTVLVPPSIVTQPASATTVAGSNVTFTVAASGSATLSYQWRKNGSALANGGNISGASSASLSLAGVSAVDAGNYSVGITNAAGGVASADAVLTVVSAPVIVLQPTNQVAQLGTTVHLAVGAAGTGPLGYQWFSGTNPLVDGANISGSTSNMLTIVTLTTNEVSTYFVVVSNYLGSATSTNISLEVSNIVIGGTNDAPVILAQPARLFAPVHQTVLLAVTAAGSGPMTYQWQKNGRNLADGRNISGARTSSLALADASTRDNGGYAVVVANAHGMAHSATAMLKVLAPPVITKSPVNRTARVGANVSFTVAARGGAPMTYQWFKNGSTLVDGGNISGAKRNSLRISGLTSADSAVYSVTISNPVGSATSSNALLTVSIPVLSASQAKSNFPVALAISPSTTEAIAPVDPPVISQITKNDNGGITLTCAGTAGAVYVLQATTDLISWSCVCTNTAGANGQWQATDNTDAARRFYRIKTGQ